MYLRCFTSEVPNSCGRWLPWAEYCYNTTFHSFIGISPFHAVYGRMPPALLTYVPGTAALEEVENHLLERDDILKSLKSTIAANTGQDEEITR